MGPEKRGKRRYRHSEWRLDIEQRTDLQKVLEERILDCRVEFLLQELLGIAKREFHDLLVNLVKRKRQTTEE